MHDSSLDTQSPELQATASIAAPLAERLFGPIDRRISPPDPVDGSFVLAVTPPKALRLPTAFVRLSCDEMCGVIDWIRGKGTIHQCCPYLTPTQREIILNGTNMGE